jgi:uncharacterized protein (DUF1778 family)
MGEKKVTITIRLDPIEKMRIKRWAREVGQSVSEYIMEAVRERLAQDEIPMEEKSNVDLVEAALRKESPPEIRSKSDPELQKKSLTDLIKDYVKEDDTVS